MTINTTSPFLVELSMWDDCGITERWPAESEAEARSIFQREEKLMIKWARENLEPDLSGEYYLPAIAQILIRPDPDADGDYPETYLWKRL